VELALFLMLLAAFLAMLLGYIIVSGVRSRMTGMRLQSENSQAMALAERYMIKTALARSDIARRNRELAELTRRLDLRGEELARLNEMKTKFLSMVVHDVRSPLAAIKGFSEILARKMPGEKEKHQFQNIVRSTEQLGRLIADLTDLAMIEAGKLSVSPQPLDLRAIGDDMLPAAQVRGREKNIEILYFPGAAPVPVKGDRFRLGQVLMNLITNALKFTPEGGKIEVSISERAGRGEVAVKDSGIGIHPSETKKIFEKFYQAKFQKDAKLRAQGWGLGLSISAEIIKAHKGEIAASSRGLGHGSTFFYRLPLAV
jgi:two-component system, sensor histidine kinase